ncbi:hypothetical protein [Nitrosospira multiformis]|uniref:Uncharacterized protein n=1 Tax=Nitrosospira multiformis TaxID=1231 RepID=A0A1I7FBH2_9PROT|nr:hypothetical protein [Nitrosospira multiformis]SFU33416.1 hypothetical protein SAMN05216417_101311 [Nitrosospira multiformis]
MRTVIFSAQGGEIFGDGNESFGAIPMLLHLDVFNQVPIRSPCLQAVADRHPATLSSQTRRMAVQKSGAIRHRMAWQRTDQQQNDPRQNICFLHTLLTTAAEGWVSDIALKKSGYPLSRV